MEGFKQVLFLFFLAFTNSQSEVTGAKLRAGDVRISSSVANFCQDKENGLYANPVDCRSFYHCTNGVAEVMQCPSSLHYCAQTQQCDWPNDAKCTALKCSGEDNGRYPVDWDCGGFYKCVKGDTTAEYGQCSSGLMFNAETEMCDFPENCNCPGSLPHFQSEEKSGIL